MAACSEKKYGLILMSFVSYIMIFYCRTKMKAVLCVDIYTY